MININHSEKNREKNTCNKVFPKKCGDKEAPVATFVANTFFTVGHRWSSCTKHRMPHFSSIDLPCIQNVMLYESQMNCWL